MQLTMQQLAAATAARIDRAQIWLPHIQAAIDAYGIDTPERVAAFLAQIGHESASLRYTSELWGPTTQQARYERDFDAPWPPAARGDTNGLAWELGNSEPGDGSMYRGHGLIQTTGRGNHVRVRDRLRERFPDRAVPDFEAQPQLLADYTWAALSAADYWDMRNLNALADAGDFMRITKRINGGTTGYSDRLARWDNAKAALA